MALPFFLVVLAAGSPEGVQSLQSLQDFSPTHVLGQASLVQHFLLFCFFAVLCIFYIYLLSYSTKQYVKLGYYSELQGMLKKILEAFLGYFFFLYQNFHWKQELCLLSHEIQNSNV